MIRNRVLYLVLAIAAPTLGACIDDLAVDSSTGALAVPASDVGGDSYGGDDGGGESGGGEAVPPFQPPNRPFPTALDLPIDATGADPITLHHCEQGAHVGIAFSSDVPRGTILFGWGVTVPGTKAIFGIYTPFGQRVKTHVTNVSHDNCVIHHEPETITTADLAPGYYFVYASFWKLSPNGVDTPGVLWHDGFAISTRGQFVTALRVQ